MHAAGRLGNYISQGVLSASGPLNPFGGAVDIIVVKQEDGTFKSTPWHVKSGKVLGVIKRREKILNLTVNGVEANFHMYLDRNGRAYFLNEVNSHVDEPRYNEPTEADNTEIIPHKIEDTPVRGEPKEIDGHSNDAVDTSSKLSASNANERKLVKKSLRRLKSIFSLVFRRRILDSVNASVQRDPRNFKLDRRALIERAEIIVELLDRKWGTGDPCTSNKVLQHKIQISQNDEHNTNDSKYKDGLQLENVSDLFERQRNNSKVVLVGVDGHVMKAPDSSLDKTSKSTNVGEGSSSAIFGVQDLPTESDCNSSPKNVTAEHELASEEVLCQQMVHENTMTSTDRHTVFRESRVNCAPEGKLETLFKLSICDRASDLEGECERHKGQPSDKMYEVEFELPRNNQSREIQRCCTQRMKTDVNEMPSSESGEDLEISFKYCESCLDLLDLSLRMEEEGIQCSLNGSDNISGEFSLAASHLDISKRTWIEKPQMPDIADESKIKHLGNNMRKLCRTQTHPLYVPGTRCRTVTKRVSVSLPNRGHQFYNVESLSTEGILPRSLDSNSACLKRGMSHDIRFPQSQNMGRNASENATFQSQTAMEISIASLQHWYAREITTNQVRLDTGIGVSLCRHLLSEGMGCAAAAQAFDSEKVSMEELNSSGEANLKTEKLVVRVGGQYFPWDAAAPIILGTVTFNLKSSAESEGAIPIECLKEAESKTYGPDFIVTSQGGWRLRPFTLRRPNTPERSICARSVSEDVPVIEPEVEALVIKKSSYKQSGKGKVRTNTPTSEQLASLNLKEGQNIITFKFSSSLFGKQQVDARLYLWKWNTRIVVSDVDGTITRDFT
eukprot:Gb_16345 [translate_table: standard]